MECTWQLWDSVERGTWSIRFYFTHKVKKDTFGPKRHGTCFLKLLRVRTRNLFGRQSLTASVRPQVCPVLKRKAQYRLWAAVRQRALVQRSCQTFLCKRWPPRALQEEKSVTFEKVFFFLSVNSPSSPVSVRGSPAAPGLPARYPPQQRHNRAQRADTATVQPPAAARVQLNVSDDMTVGRKNARTSSAVTPPGRCLALLQ